MLSHGCDFSHCRLSITVASALCILIPRNAILFRIFAVENMYINLLGELNLVSETSRIVSANLFLLIYIALTETSKGETEIALIGTCFFFTGKFNQV
jgi:hypothetical protein